MIRQRKGSTLTPYTRIRHLPIALRMANERAERWRQRYMAACKERDEAQATVDRVTKLYIGYMKWNGEPNSPRSSSIMQRRQLAEALGVKHE